MLLETWISNTGTSAPMPNPLPSEMQNRDVRYSGYAGVWNSPLYSVGKIEAWVGGNLKFSLQHPLIWGWRWAYCDGLFLVLVCRQRFKTFIFTWTIGTVENVSGNIYWSTGWFGSYESCFKNRLGDADRPSFFYSPSAEVQNFYSRKRLSTRQFDPPIPSYSSVSLSGTRVNFKNFTASEIGCDAVINQLSNYVFPVQGTGVNGYPQYPPRNIGDVYDTTFENGGNWTTYGYIPATPYAWGQQPFDIKLIMDRGKKNRVSPYHPDFIEVAIDILNRPCPIQITVDPTLNPTGENHFCMDYGDYDGLLNRFNRIEERLNELPQ